MSIDVDSNFRADFLRKLRDELIEDHDLTKYACDYIEDLIEYKITVALDNFERGNDE